MTIKSAICFFLPAAILLSGCFDCFDSHDEDKGADDIKGAWLLTKVEGGYMSVDPNIPPQPSAVVVYRFNDTTYEVYYNNSLEVSGTYEVGGNTKSPNGGDTRFQLVLKSKYTDVESFIVNDNTLIMESGPVAADGTIKYFERYTD